MKEPIEAACVLFVCERERARGRAGGRLDVQRCVFVCKYVETCRNNKFFLRNAYTSIQVNQFRSIEIIEYSAYSRNRNRLPSS